MLSPRRCLEEHLSEFKRANDALASVDPGIERPPEEEMGDFAVTMALEAGNRLDRNPREVAEELAGFLQATSDELASVEVAGPGFVNCTFTDGYLIRCLREGLGEDTDPWDAFGEGRSVLLEFVSANPTGPLHVGHGRGAVYGDALGRLLRAHGFDVTREYYVNDAGEQIRRLGESLSTRARQARGEEVELGENHYRGDYVGELVEESDFDADTPVEEWADWGKRRILQRIFEDLNNCGIHFDSVVHESETATDEARSGLLERLREGGHVYEEEGALYLHTTGAGDDKDRVLVKSDGEPTYFFNDLVYHDRKYERNFDQLVDVWGHDHHGYQKRVEAGVEFLGHDPARLHVELYQLVDLYRGGEPLSMSTRRGEFVALSELVEEVGVDPVRFNFLTKNHNRPLDFDIQVATAETEENPVYYVQYAHTRMAGILREAPAEMLDREGPGELTPAGHELLVQALEFPDRCRNATVSREPHRVTYALRELARSFHRYYTENRVIDGEHPGRSARRLELVRFLKLTLARGLELLGVAAPDRM